MSATEKLVTTNMYSEKVKRLLTEANSVILDKSTEIKLSLACLLSGGHLLIEDRPGVGKTTLVKTLSKLLGLQSQRIQFTNDLLPADILGTSIFNKQSNSFEFHRGPIFANFILADEINRATPKTQSACLQAMEEGIVTVDGQSFELPKPFVIVATQNPQENIGTFPLPESQIDRFLMRLELGLPSRKAEREILTGGDRLSKINELNKVFDTNELIQLIGMTNDIFVSENILDYVQDIVEKSRAVSAGLSPRAARDLIQVSKAWAFIQDRNFVVPEDVQAVAVAVMNHRIQGESRSGHDSGYDLAKEIIQSVPVP